jgi:hypothetical protein
MIRTCPRGAAVKRRVREAVAPWMLMTSGAPAY